MKFYRFARQICKFILFFIYRSKVIGVNNIPADGAVIICSNHFSNLDPVKIAVANKRVIRFIAKKELFSYPIIGTIMRIIEGVPVDRKAVDRDTFRKGLNVLKNEQILGVFPEGGRGSAEKLKKGLPGAGFFALRSNAIVIPCAIVGKYKLFGVNKIVFGKKLDMEKIRKDKFTPEQVVEIVMNEISTLIKNYR